MTCLTHFVETMYTPRHLGISPQTVAQYGYAVRSLERFYGRPLDIAEVTDDLVLPWLQQRLQEVSRRTVKRERGDLLTIWRWAFKKAYCPTPPVDIPPIRVPHKPPISWRVDEFERLIAACRTLPGEMRGTGIRRADWWASLMISLYWVGARISAMLAVENRDVDMTRGRLTLRPEVSKTQYGQIINLHDQAVAAIAAIYCPQRQLVWPYPYHSRQRWPQLRAILRQAALPDDRYRMFHCVRKTTYTLVTKHGSQDMAARQLGHTTDMSRHYLDESQLTQQQAADVLPRLHLD